MSVNEELNLDGMASANRREIKRFKVTEGSHLYRILPPFGTDHQKRASRQIQLHWGYETSDGKKRPLVCSYSTEGSCPICIKVKSLEEELKSLKDSGADEEEIKELEQVISARRVKRSFLLNAANKEGEVGVLEIPKTAHDQLLDLMREQITKFAKNPTSLKDGVWFLFTRSGKGFKTEYKVAVNKAIVKVDGEDLERVDRTSLAPSIIDGYESLAYDIHSMYKPQAAEDLARIVNGEPIDHVFKREKPKAEAAPSEEEAPAPQPKKAAPAAEKPKAAAPEKKAAKPAAKAPVAVETSEDDDSTWMDALNS